MLISSSPTPRALTRREDQDFKNPFVDRLEGREYLEVHARLERYTDTYDNTEYDRNPAVGVVDVVDVSGDPSVGRMMQFQGDRHAGTYSETRYNTTPAGDVFAWRQLSFSTTPGEVTVLQAADRDGDGSQEFHRQTVVDRASEQILSVVER